jgi:hypothetical protein
VPQRFADVGMGCGRRFSSCLSCFVFHRLSFCLGCSDLQSISVLILKQKVVLFLLAILT